ncbi:hypothetical protein ACFSGX_13145 [Sphingomonas arantia]|uniref:Methyltransferase FkbM domain-containing protein n=1 Tax=Sphingomonas arantia TaxID=1460676 RepID=A0ABW4U0W8_9SPHN
MSESTTLHGEPARVTEIGSAGHVVFGPYRQLTHGVYQVDFTIALPDGGTQADMICATLDISADYGNRTIVERQIRTSELSTEPTTFTLLFVLRSIHVIEYRVHTNGTTKLIVGSDPVFTRVSGVLDEPVSDALLRGRDASALAADTRRILSHLSPERLLDHRKVRLGNEADGGYVCIDDFDGIDTALSFGINDDISWDLDAADRGLKILQFDHTVSDPAPDDPRMVFEARRVGEGGVSLADLIRQNDRGHVKPNIILKMDIEQSEWAVIDDTPVELLSRLAWIVCEMHHFQALADPGSRDLFDRCLTKLGSVFATVHVHANVWGGISSLANVIFPDVMEVSFANRAVYWTGTSDEVFPTVLDRSCDPEQPDFFLGAFRF